MNTAKDDRIEPPADWASSPEQRRVARIKHDDRGNAFVEWQPAPAGSQRVTLELVNPAVESRVGYDPYASTGNSQDSDPDSLALSATSRTDLRKLSEHIKRMRELEARKFRDDKG